MGSRDKLMLRLMETYDRSIHFKYKKMQSPEKKSGSHWHYTKILLLLLLKVIIWKCKKYEIEK